MTSAQLFIIQAESGPHGLLRKQLSVSNVNGLHHSGSFTMYVT